MSYNTQEDLVYVTKKWQTYIAFYGATSMISLFLFDFYLNYRMTEKKLNFSVIPSLCPC